MGVLDAEFLCARELLAGVYLSDSREAHLNTLFGCLNRIAGVKANVCLNKLSCIWHGYLESGSTLEVRILLILAHLNISPLSLCTEH